MTLQGGTVFFTLVFWAVSTLFSNSAASQDSTAESRSAVKAKPQIVILKEVPSIDPVLDSISRGQNDTISTIFNKLDKARQVIKGDIIDKTEEMGKKVDVVNQNLVDIYAVINPKKFSPVAIKIAPIPPIAYVKPIETCVQYPEVSPDFDRKHGFWRKVRNLFHRK